MARKIRSRGGQSPNRIHRLHRQDFEPSPGEVADPAELLSQYQGDGAGRPMESLRSFAGLPRGHVFQYTIKPSPPPRSLPSQERSVLHAMAREEQAREKVLAVCLERAQRQEVLFARRKAGFKGSSSGPYRPRSKIKC